MIKKLTLESEIKKGKALTVNLVTHEIEYDTEVSDQKIVQLITEVYSKLATTIDEPPSLSQLFTSIPNVVDKIDEVRDLIEKHQAKNTLQEGEFYHYSLNGEKVHSIRTREESKNLVLQLAEKILMQDFKETTLAFKKYLDDNHLSYIEDNTNHHTSVQKVW